MRDTNFLLSEEPHVGAKRLDCGGRSGGIQFLSMLLYVRVWGRRMHEGYEFSFLLS